MYFGDHVPPHFHAAYNEYSAQINIQTFGIIEGYLPPKALALVIEWANVHQDDLIRNWKSMSENGSGLFSKIAPLK